MTAAETEIARLTAELARVEREKTKLFSQFAGCSKAFSVMCAKLKAAHVENGKLTAEIHHLEHILNQNPANAA